MTNPTNNTNLREAVTRITTKYINRQHYAGSTNRRRTLLADDIEQLFQSTHQQMLDELLEHAREYEVTDLEMLDHHNETPLVAVPVAVIKKVIEGKR